MSSLLPLAAAPRVDLVVVLLDTNSRDSFAVAETVLSQLHPAYFLGRCCLVATRGPARRPPGR